MAFLIRPALLAFAFVAFYHASAQNSPPATKGTPPPSAATDAPARPWLPFQVDEHLALELPAPPRLIPIPAVTNHVVQAYLSEDNDAAFVVMRLGLAAPEAAGMTPASQDVFYTSLTQSALTTMHAARVSQATFHVGKFEGLAVRFRAQDPAAGPPAGGIMWVLRAGTSAYLLQYVPKEKDADASAPSSQQTHFLASLAANDAPYTPPTPADWARFKIGHFRYLDPTIQDVTVERTDTTQTEVDARHGLRIVYRLHWTDEGYKLVQLSSTSKHAALMQDKPIQVRITAVEGDTFSYLSNMEGIIFTGKIVRLKN